MITFRRFRWAGYVDRMEEGRSTSKILTGKPTGKRYLGRPRRRMDLNQSSGYSPSHNKII